MNQRSRDAPRSALITPAQAKPRTVPLWKPENFLLLDPEKPTVDANELLKLQRGQMANPNQMNHNCPCCNLTMTWELFKAHALPCYRKWRKVKLDITHRTFQGASLNA